jgi:hypothetical protein
MTEKLSFKAEGMCESYCSHGGICELDANHPPPHDSFFCKWTDDEALSRADADAVLAGKTGGAEVVAMWEEVVEYDD